MPKVIWGTEPEDHDYPAAQSYLSLLADPDEIARIVEELRAAPIELIKAKDVLRASGLALLDRSNFHVKRDLRKIVDRKVLSPILLVRGDRANHLPLTIADGYHRACAVYWNNEDDFIHARLASWSSK
jgi:phosphatidylserine/phosphatidylglycerophosphate/cardiolipin synthase-like enzyme